MQKNGSNRYLTKHNHYKRSTCCPLKKLFPGTLLKNPDLNVDKNYKKYKQTVFLLMVSAFYESHLQ